MKVSSPAFWTVLTWILFVVYCFRPMSATGWYWDAALFGIPASAVMALITGLIQARRGPEAQRTWRYPLALLALLLVLMWFVLPAL